MTTYRLDLCYDGTRYNGWQRLGNTDNTIQGKLETLLSRLLDQPVEVQSSGRTDAGVHARHQVCSFKAETELSCPEILSGLRRYLPSDIGALDLEQTSERFHARYNCTGKTYVYRVWTADEPNVFERDYLYFFRSELNFAEMRRAADFLCGEHDFSAFTNEKKKKKTFTRELRSVEIRQFGGEVRFIYHGNGFLRNMVRILTGTLLEIGAGKRSADSVPRILESKNRELAGFTAPPQGLILWDVEYQQQK